MSRDDVLITQTALSLALLAFVLQAIQHADFGRIALHSFLVFIFAYTVIYASYVLHFRIKQHLRRMEVEEHKRKTTEEKMRRDRERPRSAAERIGI